VCDIYEPRIYYVEQMLCYFVTRGRPEKALMEKTQAAGKGEREGRKREERWKRRPCKILNN
jgi:hypothetical protein